MGRNVAQQLIAGHLVEGELPRTREELPVRILEATACLLAVDESESPSESRNVGLGQGFGAPSHLPGRAATSSRRHRHRPTRSRHSEGSPRA